MLNTFQNILIVRSDRIGDVVLTTPAIASLREKLLNSRISILVSPQTRDIVDGNPCLDEVLVDDRKGVHRGFFGFWKLVVMLRKKKFDVAIIFHTKKRTNLLCFLAGIPKRVGYRNEKFGFLLTDRIRDTRPAGFKHEAEYCLDVLKEFGIKNGSLKLYPPSQKTMGLPVDECKGVFASADVRRGASPLHSSADNPAASQAGSKGDTTGLPVWLHMPLKAESDEWVRRLFDENDVLPSEFLVAVHPGASCVSKRWPVESFAELISQLTEKHLIRVILIGGPETKSISRAIIGRVKNTLINVTTETTVSQLASLLKKCHLLISNDSGPVHIASAVGTPVISIFGRNQAGLSPTRWRPLGPKDVVLHKEVGCEICLAHKCVIDFECLKAISPQEVFDAAKSILKPLIPSL